ncbi:uncharacterized protein JCM15063_003404 [Sporobolomyces koalae]|uniref:uncharacterized protein n=1 Tax=Sporobolomyces koalae TaxID=500713 RepID=UPI0031773EC4
MNEVASAQGRLPQASGITQHNKRPASPASVAGTHKRKRIASAPPSPELGLPSEPIIALKRPLQRPPPSRPPILQPQRPSYHDFVLCARFRTPLVEPASDPLSQYASGSRFNTITSVSSTSLAGAQIRHTRVASIASSTSSVPSTSRSVRSRSRPVDSRWSFLRPAIQDCPHLSDEETNVKDLNDNESNDSETNDGETSDDDKKLTWAEGADPHEHDIRSISPEFRLREWNSWTLAPAPRFRANPNPFEPLPSAWNLDHMLRVDKMNEAEKIKREQARKKRKKRERRRSKRDKGKQKAINDAGGQNGAGAIEKRVTMLDQLRKWYDIDEPFTDEEAEIEAELDEGPVVGLAALARPFIRRTRDDRRRRRLANRDEDDTTEEEDNR